MSSGYLLEAQIHNASQLEAWCIHFIATHYNAIYSQCPKPLKNLDSSTLMAIEKKRWPPPWYILEADWYQKAVQELDNEKAADKLRKSHKHMRHKRKCSCLWTSCPLQKTTDALRALVKPSITCTCDVLAFSSGIHVPAEFSDFLTFLDYFCLQSVSYYLWVFRLDLVLRALEFCALISYTWPTFSSHTCRCDIFVLRVPRPRYISKTFWRSISDRKLIIIIIYSLIQSSIIWDFWKSQSFIIMLT